jgi:hypothetical protein
MSGTPTLAMPLTTTSTAFRLPSVVVASRVSELPTFAFIICASSLPITTSGAGALVAGGCPAVKVICGPRRRKSISGTTPLPTKTEDLSPLEIRPENCTRGATARTSGSAANLRRQRGRIGQAMLQRHVLVALEAAGMGDHDVAGIARRHFLQRFVGV